MALTFNPFTGNLDDAGQSKTGQIVVRAKEQLLGTLFSDKVYFIDAKIDMGSDSIEVPEGGLTIEGHGYDISEIYSTENNAILFTSPVAGYSGNLNIANNTLYVTGVGAKIFDLNNSGNNGALGLNTVNLGKFGNTTTSLGELDSYRQFRMSGSALIVVSDGLTFSGTWGFMYSYIVTSINVNEPLFDPPKLWSL